MTSVPHIRLTRALQVPTLHQKRYVGDVAAGRFIGPRLCKYSGLVSSCRVAPVALIDIEAEDDTEAPAPRSQINGSPGMSRGHDGLAALSVFSS